MVCGSLMLIERSRFHSYYESQRIKTYLLILSFEYSNQIHSNIDLFYTFSYLLDRFFLSLKLYNFYDYFKYRQMKEEYIMLNKVCLSITEIANFSSRPQ